MKFKPLFSWIIIRPEKDKDKIGKIYIPEIAQENRRRSIGKVVAIGPGAPMADGLALRPMSVKVGDTVMYVPSVAIYMPDPEGEKSDQIIIIREADVVTTIEE